MQLNSLSNFLSIFALAELKNYKRNNFKYWVCYSKYCLYLQNPMSQFTNLKGYSKIMIFFYKLRHELRPELMINILKYFKCYKLSKYNSNLDSNQSTFLL